MQDLSKISVVLPSLDPDEKLNAVIDGLLEYGFSNIIQVNDGSKQENLHYFTDAAAAHPEIHLIHHEVNRGKGAAVKTAFRWFLDNCPEELFTVLIRRLMVKIANRICAANDYGAIITGESVAQDASQTLPAIFCSNAAAEYPVFGPEIGME